jgi:hemerythrin-like metal-binding protein
MSDLFEWDPARFGLDVPAMDREHQVLIARMNHLHELHVAGAKAQDVGAALEELLSLTTKHFADEEAYMARLGYPGARVHVGVHRQLLERLAGFAKDFRHQHHLTEEFFQFLKMWLSAHIRGIDRKYAEFAHAGATSPSVVERKLEVR